MQFLFGGYEKKLYLCIIIKREEILNLKKIEIMKTIQINLNGKSVKLDTSSIINAIVNYNADPFLVESAEEDIINDVIKSMSGADVNECDPSDANYNTILEQLDLMDANGNDKRDARKYQLYVMPEKRNANLYQHVYDIRICGAHILYIAPLFDLVEA